MWREDKEILSDLASGDSARLRHALADLHEAYVEGWDFSVPRLDLDAVLAQLREDTDAVALLAKVLDNYLDFLPPLSDLERLQALARIALETHNERAISITSVFAKTHPEHLPWLLVELQRTLPRQASESQLGHKHLFSYLLEGKPAFRAKVLEALADPVYAEVRAWLAPELEEWARVDAWWREHPEQAPE